MSAAGLTVKDLSWAPPRGPLLLHPTSFEVKAGRVFGVVGANGAGKSTLLRLLYRYLRPTSGRVLLAGQDIWALPARKVARSVAVVLQEQPTDFALTVREIVALGRTPHRTGFAAIGAHDRAIIRRALDRLNLGKFADRLFGTLSGGERQRVMVARALAQEPRVLILDEPTNHLDIRHQLEVLQLIRTLGLTIITSLHDLNLAMEYTDDLLVLSAGQSMACGPPGEVLTEDLIAQCFGVRVRKQQLQPSGQPHLTFHI